MFTNHVGMRFFLISFLILAALNTQASSAKHKNKTAKAVKQEAAPGPIQKVGLTRPLAGSVLFEGYSKVLSANSQVGYLVYQVSVDDKTKRFHSTYFLKTGKPVDVTESLHAEADYEMNPIAYQYTSKAGAVVKTIDAKFKNGKMSAQVLDNGKAQKIEKDIPKGVFLSTFLFYLMLKNNEGLKPNTNFNFKALAEEDGGLVDGQALIGKEETWKGFKVFKVQQNFKQKYFSYITDKGEVLYTETPEIGLSSELVATPEEALGNFGGETNIQAVFGYKPEGLENIIARNRIVSEESKNAPPPSKKEGVPGGQGILLKANDVKIKGK